MDECPKCNEYSLHFDLFQKRAICIHNGCGFNRKMSEKQYITELADVSRYVLPDGVQKDILAKRNRET